VEDPSVPASQEQQGRQEDEERRRRAGRHTLKAEDDQSFKNLNNIYII